MSNLANKKEICRNFLELTAAGKSREAFKLYIGQGFKHHNAWFKGDAETLMLAMEESGEEFPDKVLKFINIIEEGNTVAVHSHIKMNPHDLGYAIMHIFRFEKDKIEELWDFGQQVPEDCVNENGMF